MIAAEESGGIAIQRHLPERDSTLNALLFAGVMAEEGKTLAQLVEQVQQEYSPHFYVRRDLRVDNAAKESAIRRASAGTIRSLGRYAVLRQERSDGAKLYLEAPRERDGAEPWLLFRASGTEPLLWLYAEAASPQLVADILGAAESFVHAG